jgi:hypothetical protein
VHVGQPAADVHEGAGRQHESDADRARPPDLAAQDVAEQHQGDQGAELQPERHPVLVLPVADAEQHRRVDGEDAGDDPVPAPEAGLVEPHATGNAGQEAGRRCLGSGSGHVPLFGIPDDVLSTINRPTGVP